MDVLGGKQKSMGRRASRGRVYFFQRPSMCGRAGGGTKINGPKGKPRADIFPSKTFDSRVCWCKNQKSIGGGAACGRVYFLQRPSIYTLVDARAPAGGYVWGGSAGGGCWWLALQTASRYSGAVREGHCELMAPLLAGMWYVRNRGGKSKS